MACKACRQRKVRCDGNSKCRQCLKHNLDCYYDDPKRGASRLGVARGSVIAGCVSGTPPLSPPLTPTPQSDDFFYRLMPRFLIYIHPVLPIVTEEELNHHIRERHSNEDSAALVYAWAAVVNFQEQLAEPLTEKHVDEQAATLASQALKHYRPIDHTSFTFVRLLGMLFLGWSMLTLSKVECGFFYLRQAMSVLHILRTNTDGSHVDQERLDLIYWLCFLHERILALMFKIPICLDPLPSMPTVNPPSLERGLHLMVQTYILVDKTFLSAWKNDGSVTVTEEWVEQKHRELIDESWFHEVDEVPIEQQADLIITRQWLCTLLWHMAISNVRVSSENASSHALSFDMPLYISSKTRTLLARVRPEEVTLHAFSLVYQLFEITTTIADVLLLLPRCTDEREQWSRIDDFLYAKDFLFSLPSVKPAYRDALMERAFQIERKYQSG